MVIYMNPLNYATLEACQRLVKAGIVLETDCFHRIWTARATGTPCSQIVTKDQMLWNRYGDEVGDGRDMDGVVYIPAPSMAEAWRELPGDEELSILVRDYLRLTGGENYGEVIRIYTNFFRNINNLIALLVWVTEQREEK
jgi:hypothetical protein